MGMKNKPKIRKTWGTLNPAQRVRESTKIYFRAYDKAQAEGRNENDSHEFAEGVREMWANRPQE
jgi:hypothetical protein